MSDGPLNLPWKFNKHNEVVPINDCLGNPIIEAMQANHDAVEIDFHENHLEHMVASSNAMKDIKNPDALINYVKGMVGSMTDSDCTCFESEPASCYYHNLTRLLK